MTTILLDALVPIFVGLLLGYFAGRRGLMDSGNVRNLIVLVMNIAIPCSLFSVILMTPRDMLIQQAPTAFMIAIAFGVVYLGVFFWAKQAIHLSGSDASVLALTLGFPNAAAVALPLLSAAYGKQSGIVAAIAIAVGSITVSPVTVAILEAGRNGSADTLSLRTMFASFPRALARPVVWAPMLALVGVALGLHLPSYLQKTLTIMGSAAAGSALILTGLVISAQRFRWNLPVLASTLVKCVVQPAFAFAIAELFHMQHGAVRDITTVCAIPAGFFGLVFGKGFDSNPEAASSSLIASYALGCLTLPLWILLLTHYA